MNKLSRNTLRILTSKCSLPTVSGFRFKNDEKLPTSKQAPPKELIFDELTHTGQAWDKADTRLARFEYSPKQVNPNIAAHLIAEVAPIASEERVVRCDGGHPGLGHPRVYINLDKPGTHACGYCGLRFYNTHFTKSEDLDTAHIQV